MNRILLTLSALALMLTTSCRKEYNCYCTTYLDDKAVSANNWTVNGKWHKAKERCDEKGIKTEKFQRTTSHKL
ncbi:MAG: hypothetical protein H3C54_09400 [Taibaiella sp.]|nr:hypothetical protein [Taibaiella sp.]